MPRRHALSIVDAEPVDAALLLEGLLRLSGCSAASPPLNLWLRTAPRGAEHFHWRIDIVPRLTQLAGLELGAGMAVNVYPPEQAAPTCASCRLALLDAGRLWVACSLGRTSRAAPARLGLDGGLGWPRPASAESSRSGIGLEP